MKLAYVLSAVVALSAAVNAGEAMKPKPMSKEFEKIKSMVGAWKGSTDMGGMKETTTSFRLSAADSVIVETMDAGTPHEMTNVYHDVDGKLMMTHYCAMGNAPQMAVAKSDDKSLSLEAVKANGIDPKTAPHMHALAYRWADKDHLTATWTSANMGKEHEAPAVFTYARVK